MIQWWGRSGAASLRGKEWRCFPFVDPFCQRAAREWVYITGYTSLACGCIGGFMQKKWVYDELAHARKQGIRIDVGGVSYENKPPEELWKVLQRGAYMLDYEADTLGRITALHIDRVEPSEQPTYKSMRCTNKKRSEKE